MYASAITPYVRRASLSLILILVASVASCSASQVATRPNVLIVVLDTLRADRLGAYGNTRGLTPFLDELAGRGVVVQNAVSTSSWTLPSVVSLFTSRYPSQHGVTNYGSELDQAELTLAEHLATAGYRVGGHSANFLLQEPRGHAQGFDTFVAYPPTNEAYAPAAQVVGGALEWITAQPDHDPKFLYLQFMEAHEPYTPEWAQRKRFAEPIDRKRGEKALPIPPFSAQPHIAKRLASLYDAEVAGLDAALRELFHELEQRGFLENAIVVITSDHGEEFNEHLGLRHGRTLFGESVDVPLIFLLPNDPGGRRVEEYASLLDIAPTVAGLLGLPVDSQWEGRSLAGLLHGEADADFSRNIFFELRPFPKADTVKLHEAGVLRDGRKLLAHPDGTAKAYDLEADPREMHPTTGNDAAAELRTALSDFQSRISRDTETLAPPELSEEMQRQLRALGYAPE